MEQSALLELYDRWADSVYRLALSYLQNRQDAEDIVQTVFLRVLEGHAVPFAGKEKPFLLTVTANCCRDRLRRLRRHPTDPLSELLPQAPQEDRELLDAVAALPEKYRTVLYLHYYEGYSLAEIAGITGCGESAVSMRLHRARALLREWKGELDETERN